MKKQFSIAILFLALAAVAFAHGTYTHVMGTVTKITDSEITVETMDKQVTVVRIAANTSFLKGGAAATLKDLKVLRRPNEVKCKERQRDGDVSCYLYIRV